MSNLVSVVQSRFPVIQPELLATMQVLETIDTESIVAQRMQQLKTIWAAYDPPNAAQYDVENLEFDPLRIQAELAAYFELLLRDRVNQSCRAVTLAFAVGSDLDAIGSRYPYGCPRLTGESDSAYRNRLWLSPSIFSLNGPGQGTFESYIYWALTAPLPSGEALIKHAAALTKRGTGHITIPILPTSTMSETWTTSLDGSVYTLTPGMQMTPTSEQISAVYEYITAPGYARMGLTDWISVTRPAISNVDVDVAIWRFPGIDKTTLMGDICDAMIALIKALNWLGADLTDLALKGALAQAGVYRTQVRSPSASDTLVGLTGAINFRSVVLRDMGTGE